MMRRGLCWYGQAALNRRDVGSIPTAAIRGSHPGSINKNAHVRQLVERLDLGSSGCEFESHFGYLQKSGSVGNWQTTVA